MPPPIVPAPVVPGPEQPAVSMLLAGLRCRCPRCGTGQLFVGSIVSLTVAPRCETCGLDFASFDPGDGPAVFAIMILGFLMLGAALVVEFRYTPPLWVHAGVFAPLTLLTAVGLLRPLKALLIAAQYRHAAGLGQLERAPGSGGEK